MTQRDVIKIWPTHPRQVPRLPHVLWGKSCIYVVRLEGVFLGVKYELGKWDGRPARVLGATDAEALRTLQANPPGVPVRFRD